MADGLGFTLGGAARGMEVAIAQDISQQQVNLQRRAQNLAERAFVEDKEVEFRDRINRDFEALVKGFVDRKSQFGGTSEQFNAQSQESIGSVVSLLQGTEERARAAGINPGNLVQRFAQTLENQPTLAEQEVAKASSEAAGALAQQEFLRSQEPLLSPEELSQLQSKLGFANAESTDSFFRALNEHDRLAELVASGTATAADVDRLQAVKQRVESLAKGSGQQFTIQTVNPDGTVTTTTLGPGAPAALPGTGTFGRLTAKQQQEASERLASINDGVNLINQLLVDIPENPQDFGAIAGLRTGVQETVSIASDLANSFGVDIREATQAISEALGADAFDERLPQLQGFENRLAVALAAARVQAGGREGRSSVEMLRNAKDDVKLSGLRSSEAIAARLKAVKQELASAGTQIQQGLTGAPPGGAPDRATEIRDLLSRPGLDEEQELQLRMELETLGRGAR